MFDWMDSKPAPDAVLELLPYRCSRSCKLPNCVCLVNGLKCTDMCNLKECNNQVQVDEEVDSYCSEVPFYITIINTKILKHTLTKPKDYNKCCTKFGFCHGDFSMRRFELNAL